MAEKTAAQELGERFVRAQADKTRIWGRYEDVYRFVMPFRHVQHGNQPSDSLDEIYDSTALNALADFSSDLLNAFTPPFTDEWIKLAPSKSLRLDGAQSRQLEAAIADFKSRLWQEISRSNLTEAVRECYKDLAAGTAALLITSPHSVEPIRCECIPVTDLWLERGPGGTISGKFRKFKPKVGHIPAMWPKAKIGAGIPKAPDVEIEVTEGMWRLYDKPGTERTRYVVAAGQEVLIDETYEGEGSCPLIVTRWDTDPTTAWGTGPLLSAMPDIKTLNKSVEMVLRNADKAIDPPTLYPDDGVIDVSQGVGPGDWIPTAPGSEVQQLEPQGRFDLGFLLADRLADAIKRALFQNRPEQRGLTPPTATQWLDMAQDLARRMGAPAGSLVTGWQFEIIRRFVYLAMERDPAFPRVKLDGSVVVLVPTSPLVASQEQEQLARAWDIAGKVAQLAGPEQAALLVNYQALAEFAARVNGLEGVKLIRSQEEIQAMMQQAAQVASDTGMAGGGVA